MNTVLRILLVILMLGGFIFIKYQNPKRDPLPDKITEQKSNSKAVSRNDVLYVPPGTSHATEPRKPFFQVLKEVVEENRDPYGLADPYSIRSMYSLSGLLCAFTMVYYFIKAVVVPFMTGHPIRSLVGYYIWNGFFTVMAFAALFSIQDKSLEDWDYDGHPIEYKYDGYSFMVKVKDGGPWMYKRDAIKSNVNYESVDWDHEYLAMHVKASDHYLCSWRIYHPAGWIWWAAPCFLFGISLNGVYVFIPSRKD
jgi:hypothetical protein